jgi:uncharacterized membrane protein
MSARTRIFGHPMHHVLSVFPLGLLATSFFFDLAWVATRREELAVVSWWMIFAGVIGSVITSLAGVIDWLELERGTRAWLIGAWHGAGHTIVTLLFAASWMLRRPQPSEPELLAIVLSGLGVLLSVITGWVGAELAEQIEA